MDRKIHGYVSFELMNSKNVYNTLICQCGGHKQFVFTYVNGYLGKGIFGEENEDGEINIIIKKRKKPCRFPGGLDQRADDFNKGKGN